MTWVKAKTHERNRKPARHDVFEMSYKQMAQKCDAWNLKRKQIIWPYCNFMTFSFICIRGPVPIMMIWLCLIVAALRIQRAKDGYTQLWDAMPGGAQDHAQPRLHPRRALEHGKPVHEIGTSACRELSKLLDSQKNQLRTWGMKAWIGCESN